MRDPACIYNLLTVDEAQALIPAVDLRAMAAAARLTLPDRVQVHDLARRIKALQRLLDQPRRRRTCRRCCAGRCWRSNADLLGQPWFQLSQDYQRQRDGLAASLPLERQAVQALTCSCTTRCRSCTCRSISPTPPGARSRRWWATSRTSSPAA